MRTLPRGRGEAGFSPSPAPSVTDSLVTSNLLFATWPDPFARKSLGTLPGRLLQELRDSLAYFCSRL